MKRNMLKDMLIKEISLVDNPANQHARAVLTKRHDSADTADSFLTKVKSFFSKDTMMGTPAFSEENEAETFSESLSEGERWKYLAALQTSICSILDDDTLDATAKQSMIDETVAEFKQTLAEDGVIKAANKPNADSEDVDQGTEGADGTGAECDPDIAATAAAEITDPKKKALMDKAGCGPDKKALDKAGCDPKTKEKTMTDTMNKADINKAIEEGVAKATADLVAKNTDLSTQLQKMREDKEAADRLAKATEMVAGVPGFTAEQVAGIIKGMDEAAVIEFGKSLKSSAETISKSRAFAELGTSHVVKAGSALDQLNKSASEIMKSEPDLSQEQAFRKATKQNRGLYKQHLAETNAN